MKAEIESRRYNRFVLLYEMYKLSKANTEKEVDMLELGSIHGIKNGVFAEAIQFIYGEKYITTGINRNGYTITHSGKKIIEEAVLFPEEGSANFAPFKEMGL